MKRLKRAFAVLLSASLVMSQVSATAFAKELVYTGSDAEQAYELVLDCDLTEELSCTEMVHMHDVACYELIEASDSDASGIYESKQLVCGLEEHEHDEECCKEHEHGQGCYVRVEKEVVNNQIQLEGQIPALYGLASDSNAVALIEESGAYYETLTAAVVDANASEGSDTIILIADIDFDSASALSITGDVIIKGEHTISRGAYTGTLFNVPSGSSLTLDGGLTIDGDNNWGFDTSTYTTHLENMTQMGTSANGKSGDEKAAIQADNAAKALQYFTPEENAPVATSFMFSAQGGTLHFNDVTIQNNFSITSGLVDAGNNKAAGSTVNLNGAHITHCASVQGNGVVVKASGTNITVNIEDETLIDGNHVGGNHGLFMVYYKSVVNMKGGTIRNTTGWNSNGVVLGMYGGGSTFNMSGGLIDNNTSVFGPDNGRNAAVYLHNSSTMNMTGGTICNNNGRARGGIDSYYPNSTLNIARANQDFNDAEWRESGAAAYIVSNHPVIIDNKSRFSNTNYDVGHSNGSYENWWITGGIYTQDVDDFCAEGYVCIPYEDSARTDDYIVVPGYRVKYHSVDTSVAKDDATGEDVVVYNSTFEDKYFHLLPRDKFWYEMDERAVELRIFHDESQQLINKWYTEKEMTNRYDFVSTKLEDNLDLYGTWVKYITVTFDDQSMTVGDAVPTLTYTVNYGDIDQKLVKVIVNSDAISNPSVGECNITGVAVLEDGMDKAENYAVVVIPGKLTVKEREVTPSEPTPSEPTPSEPTPSEPTPSEPTPSEPTPSEPIPTEPESQPSAPAVPNDDDDDNEAEYSGQRPTQNTSPGTIVVIDDQDIPLAAAPEGSEGADLGVLGAFEIIDNMIPLGALPATGSSTAFWLFVSAFSALGLLGTTMIERKKRK